MARDPGYPSNLFRQGLKNTLYGGAAGNEFGGDAWTYLCGIAKDIHDHLLDYRRRPYTVEFGIVQNDVVPGNILAVDLGLSTTATVDGSAVAYPYIRKIGSGSGLANAVVIGVAVDAASSGAQVAYATSGLLPAALFNLSGNSPKTAVTANLATSTFKLAGIGDETLGYLDVIGNILLLGAARQV